MVNRVVMINRVVILYNKSNLLEKYINLEILLILGPEKHKKTREKDKQRSIHLSEY